MIKRVMQLKTVFLVFFNPIINPSHHCNGLSAINNHISDLPKTSAVLRVTYDGTLFHGWTAGNDSGSAPPLMNNGGQQHPPILNKRRRSRRNKNKPSIRRGEIRSVQGVLRCALAKIYGNVDLERIVVEGSSRTDAGVSANHMIALIYCLHDNYHEDKNSDENNDQNTGTQSIVGKKLPHPTSPIDQGFKPLPFSSDLKQMIYALNKMLPPDVRVADATYTPKKNFIDSDSQQPFHPSLDSTCKTYSYTFSIGELYDPIRAGYVWSVPNAKTFDLKRAKDCASMLTGTHDFEPFRGAFRGNERGKKQNTTCTISKITIDKEDNKYFHEAIPFCDTYKVTIVGDRFLYKMVRFLVGFIVHYGTNTKTSLDDTKYILSTGEWCDAPRVCAPANGLVLEHIQYETELEFNWMMATTVTSASII